MTLNDLAESRRICQCDPNSISYEIEYDNDSGFYKKFLRHCKLHGTVDILVNSKIAFNCLGKY